MHHSVGADPLAGVVHSAGAGEALWAGEVLTGDMDIRLIGEDIMIRSGAAVTVTHIGAGMAATGGMGTDPFTEEAVGEDSVIQA